MSVALVPALGSCYHLPTIRTRQADDKIDYWRYCPIYFFSAH